MAKSHFQGLKPSSVIITTNDFITIIATFFILIVSFDSASASNLFNPFDQGLIIHLLIFIFFMQTCILAVGLYNEKLRATFKGIIIRLAVSVFIAFLLAKVFYKVFSVSELPLYFTELYFGTALLMFVVTRYAASKTSYKQIGLKRIMILGAGKRASLIVKGMRRKADRVGMQIVGFIPMEGDAIQEVDSEQKIALKGESLESFAVKNDISEIIIAPDERRNVLPNESLFCCKRMGVEITDIIDFVERETGQVAVNHIYPSWIIYGNNPATNTAFQTLEWLINTFIALIIFALTWPLMVATVICIKLEDGWNAPVLYSQARTGLHGKVFKIYKFRSMSVDAEKDGAKWAQVADPRVTRVGAFIRKYRVDELPQLFNVVKGDMGFVGPRPERPQFTERFNHSIPYYNHRLNVKPGLTGWAQLKYPYGSNERDAEEKLKFDLYYIKNKGFLFDLLILLRTAEIILFGKGR
ncbi:TIGR03013 family PEP-CTERM/XrtA system glycosyltransferase [Vibrio hannami]|uniref:TIGR03013 family XrtA/PEP-CTERM system glycosyltransferase n=1 Tax=Vibrio hannami TaxID=2717094 RepID=UPI0024106AB4|nr:TIGR03013 family XrtA/PEP-CTERM system glycosyltransferase [Vibrio hannami]MDG3088269.1 TIGR03013 family PEP-CTERM/XrtA system glycosyltransferase [Vibrio hannami]